MKNSLGTLPIIVLFAASMPAMACGLLTTRPDPAAATEACGSGANAHCSPAPAARCGQAAIPQDAQTAPAQCAPALLAHCAPSPQKQIPAADVTGAIDPRAVGKGGVSRDAAPAANPPPPSYEEAFRAWRSCVVANPNVANPPPVCEPLREALRHAIADRQRGGGNGESQRAEAKAF